MANPRRAWRRSTTFFGLSGIVGLVGALAVALLAPSTALAATLHISTDPFTQATCAASATTNHHAEVEPDTYSNGSTIVAAFQGPVIMMSQNRQSLKDRAQAETDFKVNLKNELNIETLLREVGKLRTQVEQGLAFRPSLAAARDTHVA